MTTFCAAAEAAEVKLEVNGNNCSQPLAHWGEVLPVRLLDTSGGGCGLASGLGCELLAWGFACKVQKKLSRLTLGCPNVIAVEQADLKRLGLTLRQRVEVIAYLRWTCERSAWYEPSIQARRWLSVGF